LSNNNESAIGIFPKKILQSKHGQIKTLTEHTAASHCTGQVERRLFFPPEGAASIKCLSLPPKAGFNWASGKLMAAQHPTPHCVAHPYHKILLPNSFSAVASFLPTFFPAEILKHETVKHTIRIRNCNDLE
jgi:hypothetical protein